MKKILLPCCALMFLSCQEEIKPPKQGFWRTVLEVQDEKELPFIFEWNANNTLTIINAEERILVKDIEMKDDSITIKHPVFEGVFKGIFTEDLISGEFIKPSLDRVVPFKMSYGSAARFEANENANENVSGNWEMIFSSHSEEDRYIAKGIFTQTEDQKVMGTIRTTTGDYRYLEGIMDGKTLKLSTFDGAHAFLFEAEVKDSLLYGFFYSGNHWKEPFSAVRNENYELPDANALTFLKEGYERFDFSFPDTEGNIVSMSDDLFKDKVVVAQIMGTWCPNCLEETEFYASYLKENPSSEVQFVALAFEYAKTKEKAINSVKRLIEAVEVPYPVLIAQYGTSDKGKANDKLPMLNHVLSYPTTIFIDKKGTVRKIHTGFNGKATGDSYTQFVKEFETFLELLSSEEME
ncbi:MAG: TlpA disulfide reductase family protein [Bacteroidota bacterium]